MIYIWNVGTKALKHTLKADNLVYSVAITADGKTVVSGSWDNTASIWNGETGVLKYELKGHTDSVRSVAITVDGKTVVSGSDDKTVRIWPMVDPTILNDLTFQQVQVLGWKLKHTQLTGTALEIYNDIKRQQPNVIKALNLQ